MSDPEETAGPPPVKATRSDPLLDEAIALLGKEVLRLKKQNSVKVKDVEVFPAAVNGLDPSAPEFLPRSQAAYLHKRPKRSISLQNPSRGQSRASTFSLGLLNRDPVLEDVIRRLEKEVARIKMEESKPARVTKFEISSATLDPFQSLVENGFNGDKSPVTSHLKVLKVTNSDEHDPDYYLPTHNPLLDDIVVMLEREVAAIKERKTPDMREVKVTENKKGEVAENKKAGVVAIKEGSLGGKRVARGDVSSLDGKSDDGKGAEMVCICLRSVKYCNQRNFCPHCSPLSDEADSLPRVWWQL